MGWGITVLPYLEHGDDMQAGLASPSAFCYVGMLFMQRSALGIN
jgi:hypothetical protein